MNAALPVIVVLAAGVLLCGEAAGMASQVDVVDDDTVAIDGQNLTIVHLAPDEHLERIESFNLDLAESGLQARVVSCSLIVDIPVGVGGGNHSYGGDCKIEKPPSKRLIICNDEMVGHFAISRPFSDEVQVWEVAYFTAANCFGG